jgi:hypothetical protein
MNFVSKRLGWWCCAFLAYGLASHLSVFAGVANEGWIIIDYMKSCDGTVTHEIADGINRDVSKPAMKCENIDKFRRGFVSCCEGVFDFE